MNCGRPTPKRNKHEHRTTRHAAKNLQTLGSTSSNPPARLYKARYAFERRGGGQRISESVGLRLGDDVASFERTIFSEVTTSLATASVEPQLRSRRIGEKRNR